VKSNFDPIPLFLDAASEAAMAAVSSELREELVKHGFSAMFTAVTEETAKAITGHLVGPLLGIFLKAIDPTQRKLDALLAEPLQTGVRLGEQARSMKVGSVNDSKFRDQLLTTALESLERAYSFAVSLKKVDEQPKIRLTQAIIAKTLNAPGATLMYADAFLRDIEGQRVSLVQLGTRLQSIFDKEFSKLDSRDLKYLEGRANDTDFREVIAQIESPDDMLFQLAAHELTHRFIKFKSKLGPDQWEQARRAAERAFPHASKGSKNAILRLTVYESALIRSNALICFLSKQYIRERIEKLAAIRRFWTL
jgi:hypothetical protein